MTAGTARQRVEPDSRFAAAIGFSAAVRVGDWVTTAGMTAVNAGGSLIGEGPYEQAREALRKIADALAGVGADMNHVVQTRMYLVDADDWPEVGRAHGEVFAEIRPAATMVVVAGLLDPRMRVEIEARAFVG